MSVFNEANEDALSIAPDAAAVGPRVGFLESFEVGYNAQVRGSAMYGIEKAMFELDDEQVSAMRRAGIEDVPRLSENAFGFFGSGAFSGDYMDAARFYQDGGDPELAKTLKEYDDKVAQVRERYPDLRVLTSREMWDQVRSTAQDYEKRQANDRTGIAGSVGGFLGSAIGGLNVESDPLNFATIPVAGGASALGRIGFQGAAQGAVETLNQVTGVQEERRLLGLETGFADGLMRVGGAAIGGAVLQGVGEGVVAGARRFFRNTPDDPAPAFDASPGPSLPDTSQVPRGAIPADGELAAAKLVREPTSYVDYLQEVSPWSVSRLGKQQTVLDLDHAAASLNDWAGPRPFEMAPLTTAGRTLARNDFTAPEPNIFDRVASTSTVDDLARKVDPDTFRRYDKHADDKAKFTQRLDELRASKNEQLETRLAETNAKIDQLKDKINRSGAMKSKKLSVQLNEATVARDQLKREILASDTPEMARMRSLVMRSDERMRDLAPQVSRAYARARGKWDNTDGERQAILEMMRNGRKELPDAANVDAPETPLYIPESITDKAPLLRASNTITGKLPDGADAATVASHVLAERAKVLDETSETFRASVAKVLNDTADEAVTEITIPGQKYALHLDNDRITVPTEDGTGTREISVREFLQEHEAAEADLKAVQSCSIL